MTSLIALAQSPLGAARCLGLRLLWGAPGMCGILAAYAYFPKPSSPDSQNLADWAVVALVGLLALATGGVLTAFGAYHDLSVNFDCAPWRVAQEDALAAAAACGDPAAAPPLQCPFHRGEPAEAQCPACGTVVSLAGLHEERVFPLGAIVLDWGRAMKAVERTDDVRLARLELDAALDFLGHPGLGQICLLAAASFALAPWALWKLFTNLPPGFNGVAGVAAAGWALAALLLALDAVATPLAFMRKYRWIPFPFPEGVFGDRTRDVLCGLFAAPLP